MHKSDTPQAEGIRPAAERSHQENSSRRLLFVTPRYTPLTGGVETHVEQVARRLAAAGLDVHVLTTRPPDTPAQEIYDGVCIQRVGYWPAGSDLYFAPEMRRVIQTGGWDLVHVQSYHTLVAPLAMWSALKAGIPYVATFHGGGNSSALRSSVRGLQQAALAPLLRRAERLVAVARFEIPLFSQRLDIPKEKFAWIPNGADLPALPEGPAPSRTGTRIASVGRLERYKGHQRILAALPEILKERPDAHLWIAGSGPYESELRSLAEELGVEDRVEISSVPAHDRQRMAQELSEVDLVVLLSEYETHPIAVLEALAFKRPVLVADTSGMSELSQKGWVRAVPLESSPEQIARAALEQIEHPIQPENLQIPTWDECAAGLLALYESIWEKEKEGLREEAVHA
jgi:glycosyltransferase involved in cell wall biosynthesis